MLYTDWRYPSCIYSDTIFYLMVRNGFMSLKQHRPPSTVVTMSSATPEDLFASS